MADAARARKLAVRIRQIVSATIEMQIKDPRLGMVTITDSRMTSDLREATLYYTVYGDETQIADSAAALTSADGPVLAYCRSGTRSCNLWALAAAKAGRAPHVLVGQAEAAGYDLSGVRPMLDALAGER